MIVWSETLTKNPLIKKTPWDIKAADPIDVAFSEISDVNGVFAVIVVFPYITFSVQVKVSPSVKALIFELLSPVT